VISDIASLGESRRQHFTVVQLAALWLNTGET
jgi:hypothetical protein